MVYQLKVTLQDSQPLIWRRVQVPANITLNRLHLILQYVMGWTNSHLYSFNIAGTEYGIPAPDDDFVGLHFLDSRRTRLNKVVTRENSRFTYEYDFGDRWKHNILLEKILPAESVVSYPLCQGGQRACPPEDCGGIWGYADLLQIIREPTNEEYEEKMVWLGGSFDPEEFNLDAVNRSLARFRKTIQPQHSDIPEVFRRAFWTRRQIACLSLRSLL